jgi:hypothetical protein
MGVTMNFLKLCQLRHYQLFQSPYSTFTLLWQVHCKLYADKKIRFWEERQEDFLSHICNQKDCIKD